MAGTRPAVVRDRRRAGRRFVGAAARAGSAVERAPRPRHLPSRTTTAFRRSAIPKSRPTVAGSSSAWRRASRRTTARAPKCYLVPSDASSAPRRILHYGKDITSPSWTDDSRLRYSADRQQWTVDPANASAVPLKASTLPAGAVPSADRKWIALAKDKLLPKKDAARGERVRTTARGALQGRDVRLEGLPARWPAVPRAESARATGGAAGDTASGAAARPRPSSIPMCGSRTSRGTRTAPCSRTPPIPTGATSSNTRAPTCGR